VAGVRQLIAKAGIGHPDQGLGALGLPFVAQMAMPV
jgi:hypothetical protein